MWSTLKRRVAKKHPKTLEDLETFAFEEFYASPDENVQKLFKSIKIWLFRTKIDRGGFTRYQKLQCFTLSDIISMFSCGYSIKCF